MKCYKCGKEMPEEAFNFANKAAGTRQGICRDCCSEYNRARYQRDKESTKARVKKYREENPEKCFETRLRTYEKTPSRYSLRKLTEEAIRSGKLKKPERCQVCGQVPSKRIEAHHTDYSKPLEIIWCCTKCHELLDQERRIEANEPYHARVRPVICIETGERYKSIAAASRAIGRAPNSISQSLKLGCKCAGFHWKYQ